MHVFVGERTYILRSSIHRKACMYLLVNEHTYVHAIKYTGGHDEQQADTARATSVPACDSRPNIKMYSSTNGHITFRFPDVSVLKYMHVVLVVSTINNEE